MFDGFVGTFGIELVGFHIDGKLIFGEETCEWVFLQSVDGICNANFFIVIFDTVGGLISVVVSVVVLDTWDNLAGGGGYRCTDFWNKGLRIFLMP